MFYVYCVSNRFVKICTKDDITIGLVKKIGKATYWTNKNQAKSYKIWVKNHYESATLKEATLSIIT